MATGDTLYVFTALHNTYAGTNAATPDRRNNHPVLDFDAITDQIADFHGVLPLHYGGGTLMIILGWTATSATSGTCVWNAAIERIADDGDDMDTDSFGTTMFAVPNPNAISGKLGYASITLTSGVNTDFIAAGEIFRLRISRDADNGADTMAGDAELWTVHIYES